MITVDAPTVEFGGTTLFKDISFQINPKTSAPSSTKRALRAQVQLHGLRMGRRSGLRHGDGAVVSRRSAQVSHQLSAEVDRRVRGYHGAVLLPHESCQRQPARVGCARCEHRARRGVHRSHRLSRPAAEESARRGQVFQVK